MATILSNVADRIAHNSARRTVASMSKEVSFVVGSPPRRAAFLKELHKRVADVVGDLKDSDESSLTYRCTDRMGLATRLNKLGWHKINEVIYARNNEWFLMVATYGPQLRILLLGDMLIPNKNINKLIEDAGYQPMPALMRPQELDTKFYSAYTGAGVPTFGLKIAKMLFGTQFTTKVVKDSGDHSEMWYVGTQRNLRIENVYFKSKRKGAVTIK